MDGSMDQLKHCAIKLTVNFFREIQNIAEKCKWSARKTDNCLYCIYSTESFLIVADLKVLLSLHLVSFSVLLDQSDMVRAIIPSPSSSERSFLMC